MNIIYIKGVHIYNGNGDRWALGICFYCVGYWIKLRDSLQLCSVGIWGSVMSILTQFLSNRSQYVVVDGLGELLTSSGFGCQFKSWQPNLQILAVLFFLAGGVLECNLAHRRSVAMLCRLFLKLTETNAPFEQCIAFAVCAGTCYSRCFCCS